MTLLTYLSLSALFLLASPDYRGLLVAVDDRIESISPLNNSTNLLPGARNVFALTSPTYTEDANFAFLFATELGSNGPSVYRVEGRGAGHTILYSPQGESQFYISSPEFHQNYYDDAENNTNNVLYYESAAYDAVNNTIFLTNRETKTIFSLSNKPGSTLETFYTDGQKQPTSITLDVCTR